MVTLFPRAIFSPPPGLCPITLPSGTLLLGSRRTLDVNPASVMFFFARASTWPSTNGTVTSVFFDSSSWSAVTPNQMPTPAAISAAIAATHGQRRRLRTGGVHPRRRTVRAGGDDGRFPDGGAVDPRSGENGCGRFSGLVAHPEALLDASELGVHLLGARIPLGRILRERPHDGEVEAARDVGPHLRRRLGNRGQVLHCDLDRGVAREWHRAGEQLVEEDSTE